ncbi:MAG: hypothetical protein AAFV43_10200 [Planctomycetota bacterium]
MTDWTAGGDFVEVLDTLEPVSLVPAGGGDPVSLPKAWRFVEQEETIGERAATVVRQDATWHLPIADGAVTPAVGDHLIDAVGACWVIRSVERLRAATRYRCDARSTRLRCADAEWCRVERAQWQDGTDGPEVAGWTPTRLAVSVAVELVSSLAPVAQPDTEQQRVRLTFAELVDAGPQDRVVTPSGVVYRLVDRLSEAGPGEAAAVEALRTIAAA